MITQITEPQIDSANLSDWQKILLRTTMQGAGFHFCRFTNMDNDALAPIALDGSRFEVNGAFYRINGNEPISLGSLSEIRVGYIHYVYAIPNGANCSLEYSRTKPTFNASKGGWFNGNNRALLCFWGGTTIQGYYSKTTMLGLSGAIGERVPTGYSEAQEGLPIVNISGYVNTDITVDAGDYEIEIAGGGGGGGGSEDGGDQGANGAAGGYYKGIITLFERSTIKAMSASGGYRYGGGGGGNGGGGGQSGAGATGGAGLGGYAGVTYDGHGGAGGGSDDGTGRRYGGNGGDARASNSPATQTAAGGGGGGYGAGGYNGEGGDDEGDNGTSGGGGGGSVIHINAGAGAPHERIYLAGGGGGGRGGYAGSGGGYNNPASEGRNNINFAAGGGGAGGVGGWNRNGGNGGNGFIKITRHYPGG
jgi:hypothetical protein